MAEAWPAKRGGGGGGGGWQFRGQPRKQPAGPVVAPSRVLPSGTGGINQYHYPFARQENQLENIAIAQDSTKLNTLNLGYSAHDKLGLDNSFLALLSGPSHHLRSGHSQLPNTRCGVPVSDAPVCDSGNVVTSGGSVVPLPRAAAMAMADLGGHLTGTELDGSFFASRQQSQSMYNQSLVLHDSLHTAPSFLYSSNSCKPGGPQALHGSGTAVGVPSLINGRNTEHFKASTSPCSYTKTQFTPKTVSEVKSINSDHNSAYKTGTLRVFCMGTVGELFLNEKGLLGIICFCHSLRMSVAKFSEHSGSLLSNPGEAVRLESGQTIAQWRRIFYLQAGIRVTDDNGGWDWADCTSLPSGLVGSKPNSTEQAIFSESSQSLKFLSVFGGPEKCSNSYPYFQQSNMGHSVSEELLIGTPYDAPQKNALNNQNPSLKAPNGSLHSSLLWPSHSQMMQGMKEDHGYGDLWMKKCAPVPDKGKHNVGRQFRAHHVESIDKGCGNQLSLLNCSISGDILPGRVPSASSDFKLSLGQPSHQSGTFVGNSAYVDGHRSVQMFNSNKQQLCELVPPQSSVPSVTEETQQYLWDAPPERLISGRNILQHGSTGAINSSESREFDDELNKGSSLSLFLSHLNTFGGNTSSQVTDNILNSYKSPVPKLLNADSYAEYVTTNVLKRITSEAERNLEMSKRDSSYPVNKEKGKGIIVSHADDRIAYPLPKPDSFQQMNKAETGRLSEVTDEHSLFSSSAVIGCLASNYVDNNAEFPVKETDARNSNKSGKTFYTKNYDDQEHTLLRFMESLPSSSGRTSFVPASNPPSLNSVYISNRMPPLSTKRSLDASHCLLDENIKFIALKHMAELSQQKCANSSLDISPHQGIQCCPLASELQSKNSQEDSTSLEEQRQCYCCFNQDTSQATAKTLLRCPNCHSTNAIHMSAGKIGTAVLDTSCYHASSATRMPLCSGGHNIQCKLCCDEPLLLSLGRIENNCIDSVEREMSNLKVQNSTYGLCRCHNIHNDKDHRNNSYGRCGCHTFPRCLSGCCYSQEGSHSNAFREYKVCGSTEMLRSPLLNIECMKQDASASNGCGGLKKQVVMNNDLYSTAWTDVPGNLVGNSNVSPIEKSGQNLQATDIVEGQATNTAFKESDGDFMEAEAEKEDQMSNICSGCSGPSITEISADFNVTASCNVGIGNRRLIHDFVDEESGIERCGSSGVTLDGRKWDKPVKANAKVLLRKSCGIPCQPSIDPTNMPNFRCSSKFKKLRSHRQASRTGKTEKKKMLTTKWKKLEASNVDSVYSPVNYDLPNCIDQPEQQFPSFEGKESSLQLGDGTQNVSIYASKTSRFKRKRTSPSYGKIYSGKRSINHNEVLESGYLQLAVDCYQNDFPSKNIKEVSSEDENASSTKWDDSHEIAVKHPKYISLSDTIKFSFHGAEHCKKKLRPVVCGDSGIIANGDLSSQSRPPKFVSLRTILKNTRKGTTLETKHDCCPTSKLVAKKAYIGTNGESCNNFFMMEKKDEDKDLDKEVINSSRTDQGFFSARRSVGKSLLLDTERNNGSIKTSNSGVHFGLSNPKIKKRSKEIRKRSLDELIGNVKGPSCTGSAYPGKSQKILNCKLSKTSRRVMNSHISQDCTSSPSQIHAGNLTCKGRKCPLSLSNSDAFCCVCGSSNKDDINRLIECNQCFIKVHQACYGILKVPKGHWCCRPCRTNSRNIVCVLCGYEGGAITRAVRSRTVVRSLLKAWKVEKISKPLKSVPSENLKDDLGISTNLIDEPLEHISNSIARPVNVELSSNTSQKLDLPSFSSATRQLNELPSFYGVQNSVTAGMLDSSATQWVHMVCGLWTPGTRCPNVNTMSAFDVSGATTSRKNMVCSMCNRPGGSCIQCRVVNCTAYFHPWCAHQKGLLQSEIEGVDDENVGFYGRCSLHASHESYHADSHSMEAEAESPRKKEFSCARIEGYKGRKKGKGFIRNLRKKSDESSGYIVPQEQVHAWFHINGQKLCAKGLVKQPVASDTESDCRREYTRYKQAKGWKQLVVYKSGIHALGLYTSLFIARGAMVVEYVGEIVGLRVADKREIEYQSGRKLQYKSACYFFRIDKDHIIDATQKGGIARFVNHSCLPNCVAKVISVRNEKKVVFFAERDINPGEEITYDYNFNHEDEGKKIPCFCNSKNCRRYLN